MRRGHSYQALQDAKLAASLDLKTATQAIREFLSAKKNTDDKPDVETEDNPQDPA